MPEVLERDEKAEGKPAEKTEPAKDQESPQGKTAPLVDEHGEPVADDFDRGSRRRTVKKPLYQRPAFLIAAAVVLLVGAIFLVRYWLYARSHESTDDAFIDGHIIQVSPKVSGYVAKIYVTYNQQVKAGDLIVELDARDFEAKLNQAKNRP